MFVILFHLLFIKQISKDQKNQRNYKPYPQGFQRELIGYEITNNCKPQYELAYIIAILGEVVELFFVHHEDNMVAMDMP